MCILVDDYAKEYAKEYAEEVRDEHEKDIITVILELKKGISEDSLIENGYSPNTIQNAKLVQN